MSKDQAIGGAILAVCIAIAVIYAIIVIFPASTASLFGQTVDANTGITLRLYAVLIPVFIAFIAILAIGAWIGYTMATTPAPKPIEEITTEAQTEPEPENKTPPPPPTA